MSELLDKINHLNQIGIALSAESDTPKLLELIVMGAKSLTQADGGSLYILKDDELSFEIISTDSLAIQMGGTSSSPITFPRIPLTIDGKKNHSNVATHCVLSGETINIADAYDEDCYDFSGTRDFDQQSGYRTRSMLTCPLKDHEHEIIGVLQLINAQDGEDQRVVGFSQVAQHLAESLASQAAVTLTQQRLISEMQMLFESFIKMIATAIDDKSPHTGGHCRRVPVLTMMLADAAHNAAKGPLADFHISQQDRYELETAAWLHDCGKVITPEHVIDKSTKLETIYDRIHALELRFEILRRDAEIDYLKAGNASAAGAAVAGAATADAAKNLDLKQSYAQSLAKLDDDFNFLVRTNVGGEFLHQDDNERLNQLAKILWRDAKGDSRPLLDEDELMNLSIKRGTLNPEERELINHHIVTTIKILESLPFPKNLKNVPEFAGGHHEKMDGSGYPRGLKREEMSVQARIMAIADIFEALTAKDRPYKSGKKLSECLRIMGQMKINNHIDPDLFDLFVGEQVYSAYASEFLDADQIDPIDLVELPGYSK